MTTLAQVLKDAITAKLYDVHVCLPARVETYDHSLQKADVKPLLKKRYKSTGETELPVVTSVPVQWPAAANKTAYLHLPLKPGDIGMLIFCERSIDAWLSGTGQIVVPSDPRHHNLSDGIFIPGLQPFGAPLENTRADNAIFQNGQMRVELDPDGKISISGATEEFLSIVDSMLDHLIGARVLGGMGGTPFLQTTIDNFTDDRARLATIKRV